MKYNEVMEMALCMTTISDDLNFGKIPKWLLKIIYGDNFILHIEKAERLLKDEKYHKQISELLNENLNRF